MENLNMKISESPILTKDEINQAVLDIVQEINADFQDKPNPLIVAVMDGALMFANDLIKMLSSKFDFTSISAKSYNKNQQNAEIAIAFQPCEFSKRDIIIIDTIFDTGKTANKVFELFKDNFKVKSLSFYILINKTPALKAPVSRVLIWTKIKDECYRAVLKKGICTDKFLVGYGLDYNGKYRGFSNIYTLEKPEIKVQDHCTRLEEIAKQLEKYKQEINDIKTIYYNLEVPKYQNCKNVHIELSYTETNIQHSINKIGAAVDEIESMEF